jgi:hypothetical protein
VVPIAFLLGVWAGEGEGAYPTTDPFRFREESVFWHVGKPFVGYNQRTWSVDDGRPLHCETGYWRCSEGHRLEVVLAHPNGLVEVSEGDLEGTAVRLASITVAATTTAKDVTALTRRIEVHDELLTYSLDMAAVGHPLAFHLRARLRRTGPGVGA